MAKAPIHEFVHPVHPPFFQMIYDAITSLKERSGSSTQAIAKVIQNKHGELLPPNFKKLLPVQIKRLVKAEKLFKVKNSFKITTTRSKAANDNKNKSSVSKMTKNVIAKKVTEKAIKTKRLSQVKKTEASKPTKKKKKKVSISEDLPKFKESKSPSESVKRDSTPMKNASVSTSTNKPVVKKKISK